MVHYWTISFPVSFSTTCYCSGVFLYAMTSNLLMLWSSWFRSGYLQSSGEQHLFCIASLFWCQSSGCSFKCTEHSLSLLMLHAACEDTVWNGLKWILFVSESPLWEDWWSKEWAGNCWTNRSYTVLMLSSHMTIKCHDDAFFSSISNSRSLLLVSYHEGYHRKVIKARVMCVQRPVSNLSVQWQQRYVLCNLTRWQLYALLYYISLCTTPYPYSHLT